MPYIFLFLSYQILSESKTELKKRIQYHSEFIKSSEYGEIKKVKEFLKDKNLDINFQDRRGYTALHSSSLNGHIEIVKLLIASRANLNTSDKQGNTPLLGSLIRSQIEIAKLLLENYSEIDSENKSGQSAFLLACANGYPEIVDLLLERRSNIMKKDRDGNTPLHLAILNGHPEIVEKLIQNGANITEKNKEGKTPIALASEVGLSHLTDYLKENIDDPRKEHEEFIGEVKSIDKKGQITIFLSKKIELKPHSLVYFFSEENKESGIGRVLRYNPKFIIIKMETGTPSVGDRGIVYR